jgi:hypothetical protein
VLAWIRNPHDLRTRWKLFFVSVVWLLLWHSYSKLVVYSTSRYDMSGRTRSETVPGQFLPAEARKGKGVADSKRSNS